MLGVAERLCCAEACALCADQQHVVYSSACVFAAPSRAHIDGVHQQSTTTSNVHGTVLLGMIGVDLPHRNADCQGVVDREDLQDV